MKNYFWFILLIASIISSCKTDFELNAPYKTIPVVYGLLDQSLDTQFIKINKSFLGNSNNANFASINDCTQFESLTAFIYGFNQNNDTVSIGTLKEMMVGNLDSGIFYEDSQKIYYLETPSGYLNDNYSYKLNVSVPDTGAAEQFNFSAETKLVSSSRFIFPQIFQFTFARNGLVIVQDLDLGTTDQYESPEIKWETAVNGKSFELVIRFHFAEYTSNIDSTEKFIDWNLGTQTSVDIDGGETMLQLANGKSFFEIINNRLSNYEFESQVLKRSFGSECIEIIVTAGNEDLNTYMQVNEPVTSVVTERPIFTNIENGIGLFASKFTMSSKNYPGFANSYLSSGTILELLTNPLTSRYKFCRNTTTCPPNSNSGPDQISHIFLGSGLDVSCN
jgi:hypothetical protein